MSQQDPYQSEPTQPEQPSQPPPGQQQAPSGKVPPQQPRQRSRPAALGPDEWSAKFQQEHHREPTMSEYQRAMQRGEVADPQQQRDPSMQQMSDGARQVAAGAKDFFSNRVAPAAQGAARSMQSAFNEQTSANSEGIAKVAGWAPFAIAGAAFVAIISLFMPVVSFLGFSVNFFTDEIGQIGAFWLLFFLATIGVSVAFLITKARWARLTMGIVGAVTGVMGFLYGLITVINAAGEDGVSVGSGLFFLTLSSLVIAAAAAVVLVHLVQGRSGPKPRPGQAGPAAQG